MLLSLSSEAEMGHFQDLHAGVEFSEGYGNGVRTLANEPETVLPPIQEGPGPRQHRLLTLVVVVRQGHFDEEVGFFLGDSDVGRDVVLEFLEFHGLLGPFLIGEQFADLVQVLCRMGDPSKIQPEIKLQPLLSGDIQDRHLDVGQSPTVDLVRVLVP